MATSLIARPDSLSPAFNPLKYIYDSTNNGEPGFKYIFDIYEAGTANKIAERKVSPESVNGYGRQDLSKLLQGFLSGDFDPTNATSFDASNCYYRYDVKIGEEFVDSVDYTASVTQNGSFVKITATHSFIVGDTVVVAQDDGGAANPGLEGLFVVTAITGTTDFTVNSLWADITDATIDGSVKYSDNRKSITRDIVTVSDLLVFNGAFGHYDWINYSKNTYDLSATTDKLLTSIPDDFTIVPFQEVWLNALTRTATAFFMAFENDSGTKYRKQITSGGYIDQVMVSGDTLQAALTLVSGSGDLVEDDTLYYDYWIENAAQTRLSQKYRFTMDRRCLINDYVVAFRDRLGSMASYSFQLHDQLRGDVKRTSYNQEIEGTVTSQKWGYDTLERGGKQVDISIQEAYTLRTNHIKTQEDINYFAELVSSPDVYIKIDGTWYAAEVMTNTFEKPRLRQKRLRRFEINLKLSNQDPING